MIRKPFKNDTSGTIPPASSTEVTEELAETELQDIAGGLAAQQPVLGDGFLTCC